MHANLDLVLAIVGGLAAAPAGTDPASAGNAADLIPTLAGGFAAALALGYATHRLGLSPLVGYLLAGVVVGPYTPGPVVDLHLAEQLAIVGVILLMFGVGLHFRPEELLAVRHVAVPGAIFQSAVATALGAVAAHAFGWSWTAGIVYGLALSVASTVVLTRVLADNNDLHTPAGHIAVGWLVVEDLFTVIVLVVLPALVGPQANASGLPLALGMATLKIGALVAVVFIVGARLLPWLLGKVAETRSRELFTLTVLVVALGIAVGSAKVFGVSMELGAFLAGMVVGRSDFSLRAATEALPMRDAFAVLFFVSVGMLLNPAAVLAAPGLALATFAIVVIGKPLAALGLVLLLGYPLRIALAVSVALGQVGEFSFILATLGKNLMVLESEANNALVAVAIASIAINPMLYRLLGPVEAWLARHAPRPAPAERSAPADGRHRAVVVGYGPVGRTLSRLLRENEIEPVVVEMNLETVRRLREEGQESVYGDASHKETLQEAGMATASVLFLSASGLSHAEEVIRLARDLNPAARVYVRCSYLRERAALRAAGADGVFAGEGEVALAMAESVLRRLGAVPEQIDRERDRVRADLFGQADHPPERK